MPVRRQKPDELYTIIENFCLGQRRLEIFGNQPRRGWVTVDGSFAYTNFLPHLYAHLFRDGHLLASTNEIEFLRPRSPSSSVRGSMRSPTGTRMRMPPPAQTFGLGPFYDPTRPW